MKISVIIPCYNEEAYIGQAIGSLFEQRHLPDEIIVVDDGSNDRSAEIARSFGKPVTVLPGAGEGAPLARNLGADHAAGEALMFFDADDVLGPRGLEEMVSLLRKYPNGIVACSWYRLENIDGKWVQRPQSCPPLINEQDYLGGWIRGCYHPPCSILWSRAAYEMTGGWDPGVTVNQDGDLIMRALIEGADLRITNSGSAYYRRMPAEQQSASQSAGQFTKSGRESQIYVLRKIAQRLEERGMLNTYRKPLTEALDNIGTLCQDPFPELAEECNKLIKRYGQPRHVQMGRKFNNGIKRTAHRGLNWTAHALSSLGLDEIRKFLGLVKSKLRQAGSNNVNSLASQEKENEIRFGLTAFQKKVLKK